MLSGPVRVVVVDDHAVFREGLRALLARVGEVEVVGEASSTDEAVDVVSSCRPDVVLMDLTLPGAGGAAATRRIVDATPDVAVVVLTMHADGAHLRQAVTAGARGFLLKDAEPDTIVRTVLAAAHGQVVFDAGVADVVLAGAATAGGGRPFPSLTDREYEVLERIARGLRNEAIAGRLGLSTKTVQNNVSTLLLKLGARDRTELVVLARDAGVGLRT